MLHHYVLIAYRNFQYSRIYAVICLAGLVLGLTSASLIGLYIKDELSYERWLPNHQNIYRVGTGVLNGNLRGRTGPSDLGQWLRLDYPQIDIVTRMMSNNEVIRLGDKVLNEKLIWADANIFQVFRFKAIAGDTSSALDKPDSIVLTQKAARKIFGDDDAMDQILVSGENHPMSVTAIIEDLPSNTHLNINIIAPGHATFSIATEQDRNPVQGLFGRKLWATFTYIVLSGDVTPESIEQDMPFMLDRHLPLSEGRKNSEIYRIQVLPITDIHLSSPDPDQEAVDLRGIYTVTAIAVLILLAAIINFINIMTARGAKRALEIAVRKTFGASRSSLFIQFMIESLVYVMIAATLSLFLIAGVLPYFNGFLFRTIEFHPVTDWVATSSYLLITVTTGLLAGVYPAFILSNFSPVTVLQVGKLKDGTVRQVLTIVQFAILTGLIIGTSIIYRQAQFGIDEALNQDTDPIVSLFTACDEPLKKGLRDQDYIRDVACARYPPQLGIGSTTNISRKDSSLDRATTSYMSVGVGFFELYDLPLVAGRLFANERTEDIVPEDNIFTLPESVVINETLARNLGFESAEVAVGELLEWSHLFKLPRIFTPRHDARIIGVIGDFQIGSVRSNIPNATFYVDPNQARTVSVRIDGSNVAAALDAIDEQWNLHGNDAPIRRMFFDEMIENMYRNLTRQAQLLAIYSGVAISIAILGLVGLTAHITQRRTKEIGVRKTFGGRRTDIVKMLLWPGLSLIIFWIAG